MCAERCKGEGIRTPLGHSAQASMAPLEFGIMKPSIGRLQPGHVTGEPWPLNPNPPIFLCPESSKNSPEIQWRAGVLNLKPPVHFCFQKTHFAIVLKNFNFWVAGRPSTTWAPPPPPLQLGLPSHSHRTATSLSHSLTSLSLSSLPSPLTHPLLHRAPSPPPPPPRGPSLPPPSPPSLASSHLPSLPPLPAPPPRPSFLTSSPPTPPPPPPSLLPPLPRPPTPPLPAPSSPPFPTPLHHARDPQPSATSPPPLHHALPLPPPTAHHHPSVSPNPRGPFGPWPRSHGDQGLTGGAFGFKIFV
jgi:hypothetical protein